MRSKSLTRRAIFAALSFTFAGTLFSQSLEKHQQSGKATPDLMASIAKLDTYRYEKRQETVSNDTLKPVVGSLAKTDTSVDRLLTPPNLNTIASVPEKSPSHKGFVRVGPDLLPLNVRFNQLALSSYGSVPAVMRLSFGHKPQD